jgi:hypothetical protein
LPPAGEEVGSFVGQPIMAAAGFQHIASLRRDALNRKL